MKKLILGVVIGILVAAPIATYSAVSLASRLEGKILLAVEDKGKTYYVHSDGKKYRVTKDTAYEIFKKLSLGINNTDLSQIPEGSVGVDPEKVAGEQVRTEIVYRDREVPISMETKNKLQYDAMVAAGSMWNQVCQMEINESTDAVGEWLFAINSVLTSATDLLEENYGMYGYFDQKSANEINKIIQDAKSSSIRSMNDFEREMATPSL